MRPAPAPEMSRCLRGALLSLTLALFAPLAAAADPCCKVTAIDARSGSVTAKAHASGRVFKFRVKSASMLRALRDRDYPRFATSYNGPGQAAVDGELIAKHVDAFARLHGASAPAAASVPAAGDGAATRRQGHGGLPLLHVWNHGAFKSLLFFGAGSVHCLSNVTMSAPASRTLRR